MQMIKQKCVDCGHVGLIAYCPACRGRAGGSKFTKAKRVSLKKARAAALKVRRAKAKKTARLLHAARQRGGAA